MSDDRDALIAAVIRWCADECDAQTAGRDSWVDDVTDHLRCCADDPHRKTAVPRPGTIAPPRLPPEPPSDVDMILIRLVDRTVFAARNRWGYWEVAGHGHLRRWSDICQAFPEARWVPLDVVLGTEPVPLTPEETT